MPLNTTQAIRPVCQLAFEFVQSISSVNVYLSQNNGFPRGDDFIFFTPKNIKYKHLCDDFGPMNFATIAHFTESLDNEIAECKSKAIVYRAGNGPREFTNAAFLLGAFMLLRLGISPDDVAKRFSGLHEDLFEDFRDATFSVPDFRLLLIDCWAGLHKAIAKSWVTAPTPSEPKLWGDICLDEYTHYENPLNGNLHVLVPGKLVAFPGPRDLVGQRYRDDAARGARDFSPEHYLDIFQDLGVSTVVRLNEARYDSRRFTDRGLAHHDLYIADCTAPPPAVVARFARIVDAAPGLVAVHCSAGLGRTGTLAALHLMRRHAFSAREAMGWLRIVRPGSVIGGQQHYLCAVERQLHERAQQRSLAAAAATPPPALLQARALFQASSAPHLAPPPPSSLPHGTAWPAAGGLSPRS
jgi:cell division cycle 14